jgi:hypothetical protein
VTAILPVGQAHVRLRGGSRTAFAVWFGRVYEATIDCATVDCPPKVPLRRRRSSHVPGGARFGAPPPAGPQVGTKVVEGRTTTLLARLRPLPPVSARSTWDDCRWETRYTVAAAREGAEGLASCVGLAGSRLREHEIPRSPAIPRLVATIGPTSAPGRGTTRDPEPPRRPGRSLC